MRTARLVAAWLLAAGLAAACGVGYAHAAARFGDSAWVAPYPPMDGDSAADGPRVAARDHERRWETALRAPFRVAFFPLRLAGDGLEALGGYVGPRYFEPKPKPKPKPGPALSPAFTLGAINDVGIGPALTWRGFPSAAGTLRIAGTWSTVDRRRAHVIETIAERRPVAFRLRADYDDKPDRRYYGIGNASPKSHRSYYLLETTTAEAALLLGASPLRQLRLAGGGLGMSPARGSHGTPLLENAFAPADVPFEHRTTRVLWYGVSADLASLDEGRDPSRGLHGRVDLRRAAGMRSVDPDYDQWRLEGRGYLPVFARRRVLAVRAVYAGVEPRGGTTVLPYYLLPMSEGATRFVGFDTEHFRDRRLLLARIEYRWAILYRMSALGLYELGEVAPRTGDFTLRDTHVSYGGGLRLGLSDVAALRFELADSVEGLHAVLVLGSDF